VRLRENESKRESKRERRRGWRETHLQISSTYCRPLLLWVDICEKRDRERVCVCVSEREQE